MKRKEGIKRSCKGEIREGNLPKRCQVLHQLAREML
jgi:hypothetical protein